MVLLTCTVCGMQKEGSTEGGVCPVCGGKLRSEAEIQKEKNEAAKAYAESFKSAAMEKEREEQERVDLYDPESPSILKLQLCELALPAVTDPDKIEEVQKAIDLHLKRALRDYPKSVYEVLSGKLTKIAKRAIEDRKSRRSSDAMAVLAGARAVLDSTYKKPNADLGFSIITNSTASAAAYVGLAAHEAKMQKHRQEAAAVNQLANITNHIKNSPKSEGKSLVECLDSLMHDLSVLHKAYVFSKEHPDFYTKPSLYDLGILAFGANIYKILSDIANSESHLYVSGDIFKKHYDKRSLGYLEGAGYVYCIRAGLDVYYVSTGKYEQTAIKAHYWKQHPEEKAAADEAKERENATSYANAEKALASGKYYEAATTFGRLRGYRDAIQRSIAIWNKNIPTDFYIDPDRYAVDAAGKLLISSAAPKEWQDGAATLRSTVKQVGYSGWMLTCEGNLARIGSGWNKQFENDILNLNKIGKKIALFGQEDEYFWVVYEDGTVDIAYERHPGFNISAVREWKNIKKIWIGPSRSLYNSKYSICGLKKDGTIIVEGDAKKYENTYSTWRNIVDIQFYKSRNEVKIAALTADGAVLGTKWTNVARITQIHGALVGITNAGAILWNSDPYDYKGTEGEVLGMSSIAPIVRLVSKNLALCTDGTVISFGTEHDFSDWKNIVYLGGYTERRVYAVKLDGSVLLKINANQYQDQEAIIDGVKKWKLFGHIDTIQQELQSAQLQPELPSAENSTKKETQDKKTKAGLFWIGLGVVLFVAGILFYILGERSMSVIGMLGGILGVVIGTVEHKDAMQQH